MQGEVGSSCRSSSGPVGSLLYDRHVEPSTVPPLPPFPLARSSIRATLDVRFWALATAAGLVALLGYGIVAAILPNPIFGRAIAPDAVAVAIWLLSAPLMGLLAATYVVVPKAPPGAGGEPRPSSTGSGRATVGAVATFLAIGCPLCNKLVLLALGTSGALNLFAPVQPLIGVAGLTLLAATLAWRLRRRAQGCAVLPRPGP